MLKMEEIQTVPVGNLGIIGMRGCEEITSKVDEFIVGWRETAMLNGIIPRTPDYADYAKHSYIRDVHIPRFGTGEAKAYFDQSVRGVDLFIITDMFNRGVTDRKSTRLNSSH